MATRRYSINPQDTASQVTEAAGAAIVTKFIEVTVDWDSLAALTPTMRGPQARLHVLQALQEVVEYIEETGKYNLP